MTQEYTHKCPCCGQRYSDADGGCEKNCAPCDTCGELWHGEELQDGTCGECIAREYLENEE